MNRTSHPSRHSSHRFGMAFSMTIALIITLALQGAQSAHAFTCPFDDGNSSLEIEGLILTRYALGVTGAPLLASTSINAVDAPMVEATINCPSCGLNITGNATMTVADATIISRKLAGFSGGALTDGLALGVGTRNTPALVQSFLLAGCGVTGGTVTSITAGTGLTSLAGGSITTSGTLAVDPSYVQRRLSSSCSAGSFITAVAADGTVTCVAAPAGNGGTVTGVTASAPLASSGGTAPNLSLTGVVPLGNGGTGANLSATGGAGQILKQGSAGGAVTVGALTAGDLPDLGTSYIKNGTAQQAASSFNISGNGVIGTKLTVAGTIESTSGGVKFPDGTVQATAATAAIAGFQWQVVAATTQQALPNKGYVLTNAGQVTLTLPTAPNVGDTVRVSGVGAGGWRLEAGAECRPVSQHVKPRGERGLRPMDPRDSSRQWIAVASSADGSKLVAVDFGGKIYTSTDSGVSWTARELARQWYAVATSADGSKLVAGVYFGQLYTSTDSGVSWVPRDSPRGWRAVASSADGSKLVAVDLGGRIYTSTDSGVSWTPRDSARQWFATASSADGGKLVALESAGQIYTSTDSGVSWSAREGVRSWSAVASSADGSKLVAVVGGGQIYTSTDSGVIWTTRESNRQWSAVASSADGSKLVAGVAGGLLYTAISSTTLGAVGYLSGGQSSAIELQYIGNGQFAPLSYVGPITNN